MSVVSEREPACTIDLVRVTRASLRTSTMLRCMVVTALGASTLYGCNQAEPPRAQSAPSAAGTTPASTPPAPRVEAPAPAASASAVAPTASATVTQRRCIAPWPKSAGPRMLPASECPSAPGAGPAMPHGRVQFVEAPGKPEVTVERALDDETRALGLMYRTHMDDQRGMLFSWDEEETRSFWMRNTCIPLDMLFIASDGTIVGILEQVPTLNTLPRSVPCPAQHVLELNAGWARKHGVEPGQRVHIET